MLEIVHVAQEDIRTLQKLMAVGILPGRKVEVVHRYPSYVVRVGNTTVALGEEIAEKIYVNEQF
ncbi:FeoA family protein [Thermococcus thermotolerans]|uniref:FeoA family protein n=1 Tax=Thermococcus thermotolerans TaxID=2969672 RepID=UPI0021589772|nr:FeoA family protein [Thermococcus thermotolerans]